ncbi:hypothetical protein PMAYCL1PPCAC_32326, partial [Pristionchus mayeri]
LVMMEGGTKSTQHMPDIRFFIVFQPKAIGLIFISLALKLFVDFLRRKLIRKVLCYCRFLGTMTLSLELASRCIHIAMVTLLFLFYQSVFNGNAAVGSSRALSDFPTVSSDLLQGSRRLLIDVGILMENEYAVFGPRTTFVDSALERIEQMCSNDDDVVLFWDDEMLRITDIDAQIRNQCWISRINTDIGAEHHPLPRLRRSMQYGQAQYLMLPRNSTRKMVDALNRLLQTVFSYEMRTSLLYRRIVPARGHGAAFTAYQETFQSGNAPE